MAERRFSPKCGKCRQRSVALVTIPYDITIDHDGRKYQIHIPALTVPRCAACGEIAIDDEADRVIEAAFRQEAKLLAGAEIRRLRERLGLTQQELADRLGIAGATLSRWETGAQRQQRAMDVLLRLFFNVPEARAYLTYSRVAATSATTTAITATTCVNFSNVQYGEYRLQWTAAPPALELPQGR